MADRLAALFDFFWPGVCCACGNASPHALCASCAAAVVAPIAACARCGLATEAPVRSCSACRHAPPPYEALATLGPYVRPSPLASSILALKFHGERRVAAVIGALLAEHYPFGDDALLVPVPLHPVRLRERGYNQAALLVRALARRRRLPFDVRALRRRRHTAAQAMLASAGARLENTDGAFVVRTPRTVAGRDVVLVDDVVTTGATAAACARALRTAGASRVFVLAVGRTP